MQPTTSLRSPTFRTTAAFILLVLANQALAQSNTFPSSGNVGLGTTSPSAPLHLKLLSTGVADAFYLQAGGNGGGDIPSIVWLNSSGAEEARIFQTGNGNGFRFLSAGPILFNTGITGVTGTNQRMVLDSSGNVGIGTGSPLSTLHVMGTGRFGLNSTSVNNIGGILLASGTGTGGARQYWIGASDPTAQNNNMFEISDYDGATNYPLLTILGMQAGASGGNVGIGTTNPTQKLSVNGTIRAHEMIVDSGWSDYVFEKDYKLEPLPDLESKIREDHHLPGIPSADDISKHGLTVGENQAKLLAKIEELTLYVIQLDKENKALAEKVALLQQKK